MSPVVDVDGLTAVPDLRAAAGQRWAVYRAGARVGVLEQHREGGLTWLAGRVVDDVTGDLSAVGPTALSVLRRLATRRDLAAAASPVRR